MRCLTLPISQLTKTLNPHISIALLWLTAIAASLYFEFAIRHTHVPSGIELYLPLWINHSFPSFVWMLIAGLGWLVLSLPRPQMAMAFMLMWGTMFEALQGSPMLPNTVYDPNDMAALQIAWLITSLIGLKFSRTKVFSAGKKITSIGFLGFALVAQLSCTVSTYCDRYAGDTCNEAIVLSYEDMRQNISPVYDNTALLTRSGKLYQLGERLGIVDNYKGVHIFDITDVQNPQRALYLPIPGVTDISVKDNRLYANAFTDLVIIELADLEQGVFDPMTSVVRQEHLMTFTPPKSFYHDDYYFSEEDALFTQSSDEQRQGILIGYRDIAGNVYLYGDDEPTEESLP